MANYRVYSSDGSFFQKAVLLRDWCLTKLPETQYDDNDNPLVIGVAGIYREGWVQRVFHSAPILKVQDYFELETVDGVFVILKGFMNQQRTLDNGFSPEVFDHFAFGFPLNWKKFATEEFATSCPKKSAAKCVARGLVFSPHEDGKDLIEVHADFHDCSPSKSQQHDIYTVDMEVQDCEDTILNNKTTTVCNASPYETPQEHIVKAGHEVPCERSPVTSEFEADSNLWASPIVRKAADSSTAFKRLRVSSRRMTRSMTKADISKTNSPLLNDISNLNKVPLIDPGKVESCDILKMDTVDVLPKNKAVNAVDCEVESESGCFEDSFEDAVPSSVIAEIDDVVPLRTNMKACRNKEKGQEGVASKDEIGSKKVITRSKSRSKLKSASSCRGSPKKQLITSPKTRSRAKKASKEKCGSEYILSPESFSGKKSRSGRVLLPSLEFWRNQRVVYDEDGEVCGVEERV